jgi:hypothetical protein
MTFVLRFVIFLSSGRRNIRAYGSDSPLLSVFRRFLLGEKEMQIILDSHRMHLNGFLIYFAS